MKTTYFHLQYLHRLFGHSIETREGNCLSLLNSNISPINLITGTILIFLSSKGFNPDHCVQISSAQPNLTMTAVPPPPLS